MGESRYSGARKLMTGPDGIVYRLPRDGRLAYPDPANVAHEPATSPVMAAPELISSLRAQLAHLPKFAEIGPC